MERPEGRQDGGGGVIVRADLARLIAAGKKTQLRHPVVAYEESMCLWRTSRGGKRRLVREPRSIAIDGVRYLYPFAPLDSVAVQPGPGKPATTRIVVTSVHRERIGDITFSAAAAEGFRTTSEFKAYWVRTHDAGWVCGSEYPEHDEYLTEIALVERFDRRHADRMVWAVTFEVDKSHRQRLLAPAARPRGDELGYTGSPAHAMRGTADAGAAVDPAILEFYAQDARERFQGDPGRRRDIALKRLRSEKERARRLLQAGENADHVIAAIDQFQAHLDLIDNAQEAA